ncbi:ECF RNA polymerase sigma factor SigK [Haematomicrobium sanguinis]|uniref:ECF RNA polymerase sigma factor SigK n=1 Tax=Haematomicrobium sanguinis TaxID=479106 RepID=UPI000AC6D642|nr:ECF RNA polymerase sigma factor SigK [Haematomicrobium sanguinis]
MPIEETSDAPHRDADNSAALGQTLLVEISRGDQEAFSRLYDLYAPRVFGLARRLILDIQIAEEVTQEVFVQVWQTASRFDPNKGKALSWVLTITHRRAVDRIRSEQASQDRDKKVGARALDRDLDDVSENVVTIIESERVKSALEKLSELQRHALELFYFSGLTHSEIAAQLEVPLGTVKTRLRDGVLKLREAMGVNGV